MHNYSRNFQLEKEVRQGDIISPKLFKDCIESGFQCLNLDMKGIESNEKYLHHLRFVNDTVFIEDNLEELQEMINAFNNNKKLNRELGYGD